ncbi:maleylpyruvate isomerase family mycothiol-dependent enzyme [Solihabitans fulvus]|uniref:Maleylpyruvate isomerase family mycothiol-dependent enzyme n=1 Tax=Solihabitans fulvus TaxID=1892852 RepID=A0A5B2WZE7_9PSEU|nr:maleylpyruvate isomerase family mycothiol-dependent enzyme [Solihabitans fulvus]KAA2255956.1 maleylpyruvate isomerase family mycothiol-dependent enzyme [Solihabitans fulvus]
MDKETRTPTDTELREAIAAERGELAAVLDGLSERQWDAPTLCAGWRVREVVAHVTMPYRYSTDQIALELAEAGGNFATMADRGARRDAAALSAGELAATLRDNASHPWKPQVGGYAGALTHDVIHGLDYTVPLGVDRRVPADRLRVVLGGLVTPEGLRFFGVDLTGVELRADDLDWTFGSGTPVSGAAQDLALVLCGRRLPAGRLRGEPEQVARWCG